MYTDSQSRGSLRRAAQDCNCVAIFDDPMTLTIDLDDGKTSLDRFYTLWGAAQDTGLIKGVIGDMWRSRSGRGWHVTIWLDKETPVETRVLYQALLGSDQMREILNLTKHPDTICLFMPKAGRD